MGTAIEYNTAFAFGWFAGASARKRAGGRQECGNSGGRQVGHLRDCSQVHGAVVTGAVVTFFKVKALVR